MEPSQRLPLAQDPLDRGRIGAQVTPEPEQQGRSTTKWSELYNHYVGENHATPNMMRAHERLSLGYQTDDSWTRPSLDTIRNDMEIRGIDADHVPPRFFRNLTANSRTQYEWELNNISLHTEGQRMAEEVGGWSAIGAEMLSYVSDPVAAAFDATIGGGAAWAARGRRFTQRFGISGGYAAAANVAIEAIKEADGTPVDTSSYAMAAAGGFAMGGALGAMTSRHFAPTEKEQRALYKFAQVLTDDTQQVGNVPFVSQTSRQDTEVPDFSAEAPDFRNLRFSAYVEAQGDSRHPAVKKWGGMGYQDAVRPGNQMSISERSTSIYGSTDAIDADELSSTIGSYVKELIGAKRFLPGQSQRHVRDLFEQAGRSYKYGDSSNPLFNKIADIMEKRFRKLARLSDRAGLTDGLADQPGRYMPRILNRQNFNDVLDKVKRGWDVDDPTAMDFIAEGISNAIQKARRGAGKGVDADITRSVARNYVKVISQLGDAGVEGRVRIGDLMDADDLRLTIADLRDTLDATSGSNATLRADLQRLSDSLGELSRRVDDPGLDNARLATSQARTTSDVRVPQGDADRLLNNLEGLEDAARTQRAKDARAKTTGGEERLMRRLDMDLSEEITMPSGEVLRVGDLFEDNLDDLWFNYSRRMAGHISLKERGMSVDDLRVDRDAIQNKLASLGRGATNDKLRKDLQKDLKIMDHLEKSIFNQAHGDDGMMDSFFRTLSQIGFISKMGATGFTAFAEVGRPMSMMGFTHMMRNIPALKQSWNRLSSGKDTGLNKQILMLTSGLGQTLARKLTSTNRLHDGARTMMPQGVQDGMDSMSHFVNTTGLLGPITDMYRQWTAVSGLDALDRMARGQKVSGVFKKRYKSEYGGGSADTDRHIREWLNSDRVTRNEHGSIIDLNMDNMPLDVEGSFQTVLTRITAQGIQEAQAGNVPRWMDNPFARSALQFRSFTIASHERGMLHDIAAKDIGLVTAALYSGLLASVAITARHGLSTMGAPESRDNILTPERIVKASVENMVNVGLAPAIFETFYQTLTGDSFFGTHGRSTGMQRGFVPSDRDAFFPGLDWGLALGNLITAPTTLAQEGTLTKKQIRDMGTASLLGSFWYTRWIVATLAEDAPSARELERHD